MIRGIAIQKTQFRHIQVIESYAQWRFEEWWGSVRRKIYKAAQIYKFMKQSTSPRPHTFWEKDWGDACASYGGCTYMDLCTAQEPALWYANYARRDWDPLRQNPAVEVEANIV